MTTFDIFDYIDNECGGVSTSLISWIHLKPNFIEIVYYDHLNNKKFIMVRPESDIIKSVRLSKLKSMLNE